MKFPSEDEFWYHHFFDSKLGENFSLRHLQLFLNWKMGSTFHYGRLMHSLAVKRRASGLFNWIQIDCDWQTKLAVLSVQLQYNWIQLSRPKACLLAGRPFNLRRSNIVVNLFILWSELKLSFLYTNTKWYFCRGFRIKFKNFDFTKMYLYL